jgi:cytochrome P450
MTLYPEIQARAQEEIDLVIGSDRLPLLSDCPQLPYIDALVSEVLRLGTVTPLGIPHLLRNNDTHDGFLIPQDTIVMPNIWYISNNSYT